MTKTKDEILEIFKSRPPALATVSGIWTTKPSLIERVDKEVKGIDIITTKSYQVKPNPGNREPIIAEADVGCFGNAVGLKNPGMEKGFEDLFELRSRVKLRALLNVSLSADSIEDFGILIKKFEPVADMMELNFSCPHAEKGYGASIGSDAELVYEYVKELREYSEAFLIVKLTPNVEDIGEIALAAVEAGADAISAINTVGPEVFVENHTGEPILFNPDGHRGGKSGRWIKQVALDRVRQIRRSINHSVPIIGMGGVFDGKDARDMIFAGADAVGVGSALALVPFDERAGYIDALKEDMQGDSNESRRFLREKRVMEYRPFNVKRVKELTDDLRLVYLDGRIDYQPGQFVFVWIPGVGEKPYSVAMAEPLTFLVRKREYDPARKKGIFSDAFFGLKKGGRVMIRGAYGVPIPICDRKKVVIIAGGTGVAVVPRLVEELHRMNREIYVFYGVKVLAEAALEDYLQRFSTVKVVEDFDRPGRVLDELKKFLDDNGVENTCFYNVGPNEMMRKGMYIQEQAGAQPSYIYSNLETNNMCGIGICGECECGGKLVCCEGGFFDMEFLQEHNVEV